MKNENNKIENVLFIDLNKTDNVITSVININNSIRKFILDDVLDNTSDDREECETKNEEIKIILSNIKVWQHFDHWSNSLIYTSNQMDFYNNHEEVINEYVNEVALEMGENLVSFLASMNSRFLDTIENIKDIKQLMTIFSIESNAFNLHEEIYDALENGHFEISN